MEHKPLLSTGLIPSVPVEVIRSARRKKTSSARIVDGVVQVRIPASFSSTQEAETVTALVARIRRARQVAEAEIDLAERAASLARRFDLTPPASIRWVGNQQHRWGSCTPATGHIRISTRLQKTPRYVLDYVIFHELAHLLEPSHGPRFKEIERRCPRADRAEGFLEAMGLGEVADEFRPD